MIKLCPMCKGRPVNNVLARISNGPCTYCGGHGTVDRDKMCTCGRPAVRKTNGIEHCTWFDCGKAALEAK